MLKGRKKGESQLFSTRFFIKGECFIPLLSSYSTTFL